MSDVDDVGATAPAGLAPSVHTQAEIAGGVMARLFGKRSAEPEFGRYRIRRTLGQGAMGSVFLAIDPELDREVALKVLHEDLGPVETDALVGEARAMARLNHRNVVAIYDVGEQQGRAFIAMERVEGRTARAWLKETSRPWREIASAFRQAALGLAAAHEAGLVHRDFKPDNVMVAEDGRVLVADFGLARVGEDPRTRLETSIGVDAARGLTDSEAEEATRSLAGTPAYLAPESITAGVISPATDQFAFSVALHEALYDKRPFSGGSLDELLLKIGDCERDERPAGASIPTRLTAAVERGLAHDPARRFGTMAEFAAELERCLVPWRRRILVPAILTAVGASVVVGGWGYRELQGTRCDAEASNVDAMWGGDATAAVRDALTSTGVAYAGRTADRVTEHLDAWAGRWRDGRANACRRRGDDPWPIRRKDCFDRALTGLTAAVGVLSVSDAQTVERAMDVASSLTDPTSCSDDTYLEATGLVPPSEADAARVAEVRESLARARALNAAGRFEDARPLARSEHEAAEASRYLPLRAEASLVMGHVLEHEGQSVETWDAFEQAFAWAAEAGATSVAIEAALELAMLGPPDGRASEGRVWAKAAEGLIARLGPAGDALAIRYELALAVLTSKSDYETALRHVARGKRLSAGVISRDDPIAIELLKAEAVAKQASGDFGASARILRDVGARLTEREGELHPAVLRAMHPLVRALSENREYEEAEKVATRLVESSATVYGEQHRDYASACLALGNLRSVTGRFDEAEALYLEALAIRRKRGRPGVTLLTNLGRVADTKNEPEKARRYFSEAIEEAETPDHTVAVALFNRASLEDRLERHDAALADLGRAEEILLAEPDRGAFLRGDVLILRAYALMQQGNLASAIDAARSGVQVLRERVAPTEFRLVRGLGALGELLVRAERYEDARPVLEEAIAAFSELYPDVFDAALASFAMARLAAADGNKQAALKWAKEAVRVADLEGGTEEMTALLASLSEG